jgi:hypothetical protein
MSQLGKTFLGIALVGALVAIVAGYLVIGQYNATTVSLGQTKAAVVVANNNTKKVAAERDAAQAAQKAAEDATEKQKAAVADLTSKLADAQTQETTLQAAVKDSKDATDKAQAELDHVKSVLGDKSPEDMKAAVQKLTDQVAADNAEQKILQDQLQAAIKMAADYKTELNNAGAPKIPPGVTGKVTFVNRTWNFVVINVGLSNGVVPNGELIVYRNRDFLGKIKITSAEDNTAVGDILPGAKADIQVGDDVIN